MPARELTHQEEQEVEQIARALGCKRPTKKLVDFVRSIHDVAARMHGFAIRLSSEQLLTFAMLAQAQSMHIPTEQELASWNRQDRQRDQEIDKARQSAIAAAGDME